MRILIIYISLICGGQLFAQAENGTLNTNTNTNSAEPARNELIIESFSLEETEQDSLVNATELKEELTDRKGKIHDSRDKKMEVQREIKPSKISQAPVNSAPVPVEEQEEFDDATIKDSEIAPAAGGYGLNSEGRLDGNYSSEVQGTEIYKNNSSNFSISKDRANTQRMQRSPSFEQQVEMDAAVDYFEENDPASFEFNYFKYTAGNYDVSLYQNLEVAESVRPNNADVHVQMAGYFMIKDEKDSALIYMDKLIESDRLANNVIQYSSDVLRSIPENGILITHGFDDSYGAYFAQQNEDIRPDVTLMSLDFMQSEFYRESLEDAGYKLPESDIINVDYLNEFCQINSDKKLSIALTTPKEYFKPMAGKLFLVGLVFEYHDVKFDNFYSNDYLWNESLKKEVIFDPVDEKGKQLSANYLPMLLYLRKVYEQRGDDEKKSEVDQVSDQIGVQSKKYEQVQKVKASY